MASVLCFHGVSNTNMCAYIHTHLYIPTIRTHMYIQVFLHKQLSSVYADHRAFLRSMCVCVCVCVYVCIHEHAPKSYKCVYTGVFVREVGECVRESDGVSDVCVRVCM